MKIVCLIATLAALSLPAATLAADDVEAIIKKGKCNVCHSLDKKMLGPSFVSIAAMYKDVADAQTRLEAKVRNGGAGSWGTMPMPALPKKDLSDAEVKAVTGWILSLKK